MSTTARFLIVLVAILMVVVAAAPYRHKTRPQVRRGIPERDYQFGRFSQPKRSLSKRAVLLPTMDIDGVNAAAGAVAPLTGPKLVPPQRIKAFQFVENATLQIDHCSLTQISVLLNETGQWTVSMRANQNPLPNEAPGVPRDVTTAEPARLLTDHIRRNRFFVDIRCYAGSIPGGVDGLVGKPLVIPLCVEPFWVQKEQPYAVFASGSDARIHDYFHLIERVEIEFAYERD